MAHKKKLVEAFGYMRTSSATNVGTDKDSEARQRAAITGYAKHAGLVIVDWFYDPNVKGADAVTDRPGFAKMLDRIAGNGVRTIVVESPDRFARDLAVQLAGHDFLKKLGVALIPGDRARFLSRGHADRCAGAPGARCDRPIRESVAGGEIESRSRPQDCPGHQMRGTKELRGKRPEVGGDRQAVRQPASTLVVA
jgi:Resolvase, N terminal domain